MFCVLSICITIQSHAQEMCIRDRDTDGMELYDKGEEKAWLELFFVFAGEKEEVIPGRIGILGMTPVSYTHLS